MFSFEEFIEKLEKNGMLLKNTKGELIPEIEVHWCIGGVNGGNCWDTKEPESFVSDEEEPDFEQFDKILEICCPNISFLLYKRLSRDLIQESSDIRYGYYGARDYIKYKKVSLKALYKALCDRNLL